MRGLPAVARGAELVLRQTAKRRRPARRFTPFIPEIEMSEYSAPRSLPPAQSARRLFALLLQSRNLNAYALILLGGLAFWLKMPESIYGGLILGGLAILKAGPER